MTLKKRAILHKESHVFGYFSMCRIIFFLSGFICYSIYLTLIRSVKFLPEVLFLRRGNFGNRRMALTLSDHVPVSCKKLTFP